MHYPFWDTLMGYGPLMAFISITHVFISHFAIGGGLYLVVNETQARRQEDARQLAYLHQLSKVFVLVTLVAGALTGVGIWIIIGLLNPAATELLIHNFVWGWATEWSFFAIEITAAIVYYYGWDRLDAKSHLVLGWIYFAAAWLSLFVINGIITFMLTPGTWVHTHDFWNSFFNPTFWPSLVFRTGICLMLAGLYSSMVAARYPADAFKSKLLRRNALWSLAGLVLMVPSFYWYWKAIPVNIIAAAEKRLWLPLHAVHMSYWWAGILAALLLLFGLLLPKRQGVIVAALAMIVGLGYFGSFEFFRESLRKPYIVTKTMYGNGIYAARVKTYDTDGVLAHMDYRTGHNGADVFRRDCRTCHTLDGYRPLAQAFNGTDEAFITKVVANVGSFKADMPPFVGTPAEAKELGHYIAQHTDRRPLEAIYHLKGAALGRKVYEVRCGLCHTLKGYRANGDALTGLGKADYEDLLNNAGYYDAAMPAFTGDATERAALIAYFQTLK